MNMTFYVILYAMICGLVTTVAWLRGLVRGRLAFLFYLLVFVLSPIPFLFVLLLMGPRDEKKAETPQ